MVLYPNKLPESERVCFGICMRPFNKSLTGKDKFIPILHKGNLFLRSHFIQLCYKNWPKARLKKIIR